MAVINHVSLSDAIPHNFDRKIFFLNRTVCRIKFSYHLLILWVRIKMFLSELAQRKLSEEVSRMKISYAYSNVK